MKCGTRKLIYNFDILPRWLCVLRLSGARFSVLQSLSMNLTVSRLSMRLLVTFCSPHNTSSASLLDLGTSL